MRKAQTSLLPRSAAKCNGVRPYSKSSSSLIRAPQHNHRRHLLVLLFRLRTVFVQQQHRCKVATTRNNNTIQNNTTIKQDVALTCRRQSSLASCPCRSSLRRCYDNTAIKQLSNIGHQKNIPFGHNEQQHAKRVALLQREKLRATMITREIRKQTLKAARWSGVRPTLSTDVTSAPFRQAFIDQTARQKQNKQRGKQAIA